MSEEAKIVTYYWRVYLLARGELKISRAGGGHHVQLDVRSLATTVDGDKPDSIATVDWDRLRPQYAKENVTLSVSTAWPCGTTHPKDLKSTDGGKEHKWRVYVDVYNGSIIGKGVQVTVSGHDQFPGCEDFWQHVYNAACGELTNVPIDIKSWIRLT